MRIVKSVSAMQGLAASWKKASAKVGFVPTMGYLHAGHLSLVKLARQHVGKKGKVVVSIYVNPTQFGPAEDLSRYPRDLARDLGLCLAEGVDAVFTPNDGEMYPGKEQGSYTTYVVEEKMSQGMEGASRPTHFRGVATVVTKLFNIVQPDVAVFGAKDFQQAAVISRIVRDLNFPVKVVAAPTFREPDGLAMSSRNKFLEGDLRKQALVLPQAIKRTREAIKKSSVPVAAARLKNELRAFIQRQPDTRLDYIEFFQPDTLERAAKVKQGTQMALAVFIGTTRLIDNATL